MAIERLINVKIKDNAKQATQRIKKGFDSARKAAERVSDTTRGIRKAAGTAYKGVKLLGRGFKAMGKVAKAAVAATGIGALFAIIQGVVSENQKVMDTFNLIGKIAGKVVGDLIGGITKLVTSPKDFSKNIKDFVLKRFEQLKEALGILGGAFIKLFKGDFKGALADAKNGFVEMFDVVTGEDGGLETIKNYAKEVYKTADAAVKAENNLKLYRAESDKIKESLEGQMEAERAVRDDATQSIQARLEANERLKEQTEEFAKNRLALAQKEVDAAKAALAIDENNVDAKVALIEAEKQLATVTKETNALKKDNQIQENALLAEAASIQQSALDTANEVADIEAQAQMAKLRNIKQIIAAEEKAAQEKYDRDLAALQNLKSTLTEGTAAYQEALNQEALLQANKAASDEQFRQRELDEERRLQEAKLALASSGLGSLSSLLDAFEIQDEKKKKKLFRVQKALNLSQAAMDTYGGVVAALKDTKGLTGFERWGNAAAVGLAGAANIAKIMATKFGGTAGGADVSQEGSGPQALAVPTQGVFAAGGFNPIAEGSDRPIKAYVVSSEVTSQQELDRKRADKASF